MTNNHNSRNSRRAFAAGIALTAILTAGIAIPATAFADTPAPAGPAVVASGWVTGTNGSNFQIVPTVGPQPLIPTNVETTPQTAVTYHGVAGAQESEVMSGQKVQITGTALPSGGIQASDVNIGFML
ncbi:hypothetical protein AB0N05_24305 [Nocardia sp. NPDC051030]|uniref:hypothetical protein n=1 Tax=Nocardia sp. NPDC051030 TaxID=3155162 RepID=UPI00343B712B